MVRIFHILTTLLATFNCGYLQAQTGTFTDPRDGNTYETIVIGNNTWFREHLRYKSRLSYFPNFNKDTTDLKYGNYYSYNEMKTICPQGWHVASVDDFEDYIRRIASLNNVPDSAILRNTTPNKDSSLHILIGSLNPLQDTLLRFELIGWVEGNKVGNTKNVTIWLTDTRTNDDKFHTHIGSLGYFIHTHLHNVIDKPRRIRKFTVRCVCETGNAGRILPAN